MIVVGFHAIRLIGLSLMVVNICFAGEMPNSPQDMEIPETPIVPVPEKNMPAPAEPTRQLPQAGAVTPAPDASEPVQPLPSLDTLQEPNMVPTQANTLQEQLKAPLEQLQVPSEESGSAVTTPAVTTQPGQVTPVQSTAVKAVVPITAAQPIQQPAAQQSSIPSMPQQQSQQPVPQIVRPSAIAPVAAPKNQENMNIQQSQDMPVHDETPSDITVEEEELVGIDTVDLDEPQGNWLFKRLWWERAEEKYEEIRSLEAHVLELRMPFFLKRTDVDRTILDPFYLHVAKDRGALEVLLADIAEFLAAEEAQEGMLDETERGLRNQLQAESETLEQLQKNIQSILNFDHELDAAIGTLMEQLNRVSEYEREAWHYFKEIGRVLNDKKAREYVLKMKNIQRNIKEIQEYIQERFSLYFDQLIGTIKENADQVTVAMDKLQEKGIDLKEQLGHIKDQGRIVETEEIEEAPRPKIDNRGFFEKYIISPISSFFGIIWDGIVTVVQWPYNLIFGSKKPAPIEEMEYEEVAVEPESPSEED